MSKPHPLIAAALAMPAVCELVVRYDDGDEKRRGIRSWKIGERERDDFAKKVGREFVNPANGKLRRMVSAELVEAAR